MAVTIRDVAEKAGVSASTVSRVLNGKGTISGETKKRIFDVMEELQYVPNDSARSFACGSPRAIALVVDVSNAGAYSNSFFNDTVFGIETAAHRAGYSLVVMSATESVSGVERLVLGKRVDGVICPDSLVDRAFLKKAGELHFPCVILGQLEGGGAETSWVDINNTQAGALAVRHLLSKGYREIAFLGGTGADAFSRDRISGYRRELAANGIPSPKERIIQAASTEMPQIMELVNGFLNTESRPDAIICSSDRLALGALRAAKMLNLRVPDDLGVLCFDNTVITELAEPSITSIDVDTFELGVQAAGILIDRVENPDASIRQTLLATKIIQRASTGRA